MQTSIRYFLIILARLYIQQLSGNSFETYFKPFVYSSVCEYSM
jgi:hypothetical protein